MTTPTGPSITTIHNAKTGASNEGDQWVRIVNDGAQTRDSVAGRSLTRTDQQLRPHVYTFTAALAGGQAGSFAPGEAIYVFTGRGPDVFIATPSSGRPQFHLFWNRDAMVWNNSGDRVYLRHPDGTFATQPFPIP
jgi:Lamin Tail Domain